MKPQFGVCKNKVGCSLAYTGEKVPLPPDSKCPECGQPLVIEKPKAGANKTVLVAILLLLLVLASVGVAAMIFKDKIAELVFHKPAVVTQLATPSPEDSGIRPIQSPAQSADQSNSAASSPDSASSTEDKGTKTPAQTPPKTPPVTEEPEKTKTPPSDQNQTTPPPASTPAQTDNSSQTRTESEPPPTGGGEVQPAAALSKKEVEATREDVLKRINAMPKFSAEEKKRLSEKMQMARSMDRLIVMRFETGQTNLGKSAADDLMKRFKTKEVQDKISDPTVVFVVAGYADTAGDPKKNLQLSQLRADNVTKILKERTNLLNVVHSVGMGSTDLLDSKRSDQNRAVEIWAVAP
jgi:outer membrane protein OmpA-like peptidoglycan-associated protein